MTRVFLLDDHELVRRGLVDLLDAESDLEVVGEASTVEEARRVVASTRPDVAVLDVRLPDGSGIELCRDLVSQDPHIGCLMLTSYEDERALVTAALAGARGYLLKDIKGNDLVETVRRVADGQTLLDPGIVEATLTELTVSNRREDPLAVLSPQERVLLEHIAKGLTNRQIAGEMFLAEKTIKNYVSNMLLKLGMERRTEAAVFATRLAERRQNTEG